MNKPREFWVDTQGQHFDFDLGDWKEILISEFPHKETVSSCDESEKLVLKSAYDALQARVQELESTWVHDYDQLRAALPENVRLRLDYEHLELVKQEYFKEIARLKSILAQEASENDELGAEYTLVNILREEIQRLKAQAKELEGRLSTAQEALIWAEEMFIARDEMNAKVHCAPLRLSPITERVKQARAALSEQGKR